MPLGGGAGDIVKALELVKWIYDNCFLESRIAGRRYFDFRDEVRSLRSVLETLRVDSEIEHPIYKDIVGDFLKTLKACEDFLKKHKRLEEGPASIGTNVLWGLYTGDEVVGLRNELQFHVRTLNLLVTAQTGQDVSELIEASRSPGVGWAALLQDPVPEWLSSKFQEKITENTPFQFKTLEDIPLGKGYLALLSHFDSLSEGGGKEETTSQLTLEYLGLLKCHWLINVLRRTKGFRSRPLGSPARRLISNLDVMVKQRLENRTLAALIPATDDDLKRLEDDDEAFHIWEIPKGEVNRLPWEAGEGEEKILTVSLTRGEKLVFLRSSQDSTVMRIVPIMETAGVTSLSHNHSEMRLNTKSDKFIPHYTVDETLVADIHQSGFKPVRYELLDMKAAWHIQRAITGYHVRGDEPDVTWSIQRPAFSLTSGPRRRRVNGRAHIWQWNPFPKESAIGSPAPSTSTASTPRASIASTSRTSIASPTRASMASPTRASTDSFMSDTRSMHSIAESQASQASTLVRENEDHRQILQPIPPAIVLFGRSESTHSYVHLDMSGDLEINPKSCDCSKTNGQCKVMVIERPNQGTFKIRRVSVDEKSLGNWDLAVLRGPVHPSGYKSSDECINCDYLSIKFPTPEEREGFDKRLRTYMGLYRKLFNESALLERSAIQEANRPTRRNSNSPYPGSPTNSYLGSQAAGAGLGSSSSQAPELPSRYQLPPTARFSSFNLNL